MITEYELKTLESHARNALSLNPKSVDANDKLRLAGEVRRLRALLAEHHTSTYLMDVAGSPDKIANGIGETCHLCNG